RGDACVALFRNKRGRGKPRPYSRTLPKAEEGEASLAPTVGLLRDKGGRGLRRPYEPLTPALSPEYRGEGGKRVAIAVYGCAGSGTGAFSGAGTGGSAGAISTVTGEGTTWTLIG